MIALKEINRVIIHPKAIRKTPLPNIIKTTGLGTQVVTNSDNKPNEAPQVMDFKAQFRYI
jgi:hypothetical protein